MEVKEKETEVKTKKSALKTVFNVCYYIVIGIIILAALLYMFVTFSTKDGVTSVFGYIISSVQSGSMSGTFEKGDMIVIKEVDTKDIQPEDIISFFYIEPQSKHKIIVTHRVIEIENGRFITQGDVARKNHSVDQIEQVAVGDVIGEYTGTKIAGLGKVTDFLKTSVGFFVCILVPVFLFLFWQIYVFAKTLIEANALGKKKAINDQARELAKQMLMEMQQQQQAENSNTDSDEPSDKTE